MGVRKIWRLIADLFQVLPTEVEDEENTPVRTRDLNQTIVLISGFAASQRGIKLLRRRFLREGYQVHTLSLDMNSLKDSYRGLYKMAEELSAIITKIRKNSSHRKGKIQIVAHSAGGLVARYYLQQLGGDHYCDGLVTLGTPHSGSWYAILGFFSLLVLKARILFQMLPISPFMQRLNRSEIPPNVRIVSIYSDYDLICARSARHVQKIHAQGIETIQIPRLSHSQYLLSKRVFSRLLECLSDNVLAPIHTQRVATHPVGLFVDK